MDHIDLPEVTSDTPVKIEGNGYSLQALTNDISLSGFSISPRMYEDTPHEVTVTFPDLGPLKIGARRIYYDNVGPGKRRMGFAFVICSSETRNALMLNTIGRTETWETAHERRIRNNGIMAIHFAFVLLRGHASYEQVAAYSRFDVGAFFGHRF
ncbi:MAG: hypothetical protein GF401_08695 [Chitinivibrionales bacterium]|nr:hypothetical protein [Chitinivibrionales bacterium]